ncbi:MAG TPA: HD domain-containing protein, partial [Sphingobacteriaceae bacterium]
MKEAEGSPEMHSLVEKTAAYVRDALNGSEAGHDWWHIQRVWNNARTIAAGEQVDMLVVELAALLHDIADSKFHGGDEEVGPRKAGEFLASAGADPELTEHVQQIIRNM